MFKRSLDEIIQEMVRLAVLQPDGSAVYTGTPRDFMEVPGKSVSSGPKYKALYGRGISRQGKGRNAEWTIPSDVVRIYRQS